ncbi:MAG: hypothetical protein NTU83_06685 [Candidatus Hydrogenedentes bacterium]|nr:hypothetical protein [Candidatus Hydrogenedentota bacterium]
MGVWLCLLSAHGSAGPSGWIAYLAGSESGGLCVHVLDVADKTDTGIGSGDCDGAPVWSPDGAWLAFSTRKPEGIGIVLARQGAVETRSISHANEWNSYPEGGEDFAQRIMVYDVETNSETAWGGDAKGLMRPMWLPNFRLLSTLNADPRVKNGNAALDRIKAGPVIVAAGVAGRPNALSTGLFFVTADTAVPFPREALPSATGQYAEWAVRPSPNGLRLAFESNDGGDREIFCYTRERAVDVSNHRAADWNPVWSPDSRWVAFESFRGGRRGVYRIYADTARVSTIAASPDCDDWSPAWSPDGKWIAYVSNRTGDPEIYVSDPTGEHTIRITEHPGLDYAPSWCPRGHKP